MRASLFQPTGSFRAGDHLFGCLLQHLLPLNIVSSSGVRVTYNAEDFAGEDTGFGFSANFAFHNEETCGGNRRISSPIGKHLLTDFDFDNLHFIKAFFGEDCYYTQPT